MAKQKLTFEASMQRLDEIVVQLKKGSDGAPVELPFETEE